MYLQNSEPEVGIEILMERMKKLKESQEEEPTEEERRKRFEKVEFQSAECRFALQNKIINNPPTFPLGLVYELASVRKCNIVRLKF